ncbi:MKI67 FHA domain-interacting nucleolar phosphoprotein-like [Ceratina calcarata]|uniref:MKI67 FHA domain-interacting nucleolar phosphoprotein-like n=1 Tax=Ceratina calcarata TaxID=156304 RepID=A0AAJ7IWU1_9HYME|nr:MKI67 FHA domain-interacting nucleolar phosphoprotein-like [Ceratina calcarata]
MKIKKRSNAVRVPPLKKAIRIKRNPSDVESTVSKAIENVKNVLKKKRESIKAVKPVSTPKAKEPRRNEVRSKKRVQERPKIIRKREPRGVVYIGHIPHGFYEEQMSEYFKQFGRVTRVRLVRSRNSGRSCGYGYVEFAVPEVAKIAAETMNNYLMCDRLLKATYIPVEKQHPGFFAGKSWSKEIYPKAINRKEVTRIRNGNIKRREHKSFVQSTKDKLSNLEKKMKEQGFDMEFIPIDN